MDTKSAIKLIAIDGYSCSCLRVDGPGGGYNTEADRERENYRGVKPKSCGLLNSDAMRYESIAGPSVHMMCYRCGLGLSIGI